MSESDSGDLAKRREIAETEMRTTHENVLKLVNASSSLSAPEQRALVISVVAAQRQFEVFCKTMDDVEMCIANQAMDSGHLPQPKRTNPLIIGGINVGGRPGKV